MAFDATCCECIHDDPDAACPIALIQTLYNYEQIGNKLLENAINMLVNARGVCKMKPLIDKLRERDDEET